MPTAQVAKSCMNSRRSAECLDSLFADALKKHSTLEILQLIERYEAEDPELRDAGARNGDRTGHIIQVSKVPLNTSVPKFFLLSLRRVSETVNSR